MAKPSSRFCSSHLGWCRWLVLTAVLVLPVEAETVPRPQLHPSELLERYASAVMTVQFVSRVNAGGSLGSLLGGSEEFASEATCLIIHPRGVAVCSKTRLDGMIQLMKRSLGPAGRGLHLTVQAVDLRVLIDNGDRLEARVMATDAELDLAWVEILAPSSRSFDAVNLDDIAEVRPGDRIFVLQRLEEYFDRAPIYFEGQVGGQISLPRRLYVPTIPLEMAFGLPVFSPDGRLVGITVLQLPEAKEPAEAGGTLGLMRQTTELRSMARTLILPAATLARATARVLAASTNAAPVGTP